MERVCPSVAAKSDSFTLPSPWPCPWAPGLLQVASRVLHGLDVSLSTPLMLRELVAFMCKHHRSSTVCGCFRRSTSSNHSRLQSGS